jgi:hypothetical protein
MEVLQILGYVGIVAIVFLIYIIIRDNRKRVPLPLEDTSLLEQLQGIEKEPEGESISTDVKEETPADSNVESYEPLNVENKSNTLENVDFEFEPLVEENEQIQTDTKTPLEPIQTEIEPFIYEDIQK